MREALRCTRVKAFEQDTTSGLERDINAWLAGYQHEHPDTIPTIVDIKYAAINDPGFPNEQARYPFWYSALVIYTI